MSDHRERSRVWRGRLMSIAVLVAFVVVCYAIGKTAAWFKNRRFGSAWSPLLPILGDARIASDGGVAVTSRLSGTYQGAQVHALMTPNIAHKYGPARNGNVFSVALENVAGAADWSIVWNVGLPLVGNSSWVIRSADVVLAKRARGCGSGCADRTVRPREHALPGSRPDARVERVHRAAHDPLAG